MKFRKQRLGIDKAKEMDMVLYLSKLGFEPIRIRANDYWYHSPFRDERTPSFKINRRLNRWYDHGMGKGGNCIDFGILYFGIGVAEFLEVIVDDFSFQKPHFLPEILTDDTVSGITILADYAITSTALLSYLNDRRIPIQIADLFCREIRYDINGRNYVGIGFGNDLGGWEIRNRYFKTASSPKAVTCIKKGARQLAVFEGFFDFLSFMVLHPNVVRDSIDFLILNSLSFFERSREIMESYDKILLYMDNDKAGKNLTTYALTLDPKYSDESILYRNHKDLNDWLVNFGKPIRLS